MEGYENKQEVAGEGKWEKGHSKHEEPQGPKLREEKEQIKCV